MRVYRIVDAESSAPVVHHELSIAKSEAHAPIRSPVFQGGGGNSREYELDGDIQRKKENSNRQSLCEGVLIKENKLK